LPDKAIDLVDEAAAKLKMEVTSKPLALDELDRRILQLDMERLSLSKAAAKDRSSAARLQDLDKELQDLRGRQQALTTQWDRERSDMQQLTSIKEEVERVNLEVQQVGLAGAPRSMFVTTLSCACLICCNPFVTG
jgi:ATP-dependent Clp protease ATP-binding subunit ClpB